MLRYVVPLIFVLSSADSWRNWSQKHQLPRLNLQVASESQVKFALENKFDDTGPGARQPEYAYHTYKNLEDALIAFLDDPNTKLPEHEREKAINKLTQQDLYTTRSAGLFQKDEHFKILQKHQLQHQDIHTHLYNFPIEKHFYAQDSNVGVTETKGLIGNDVRGAYQVVKKEPFKFQKVQTVKGNPLSLAHYLRDRDLKLTQDQFDPDPKYLFSYGVHDKKTGDSKIAQESRDGGNVQGFYSFIDSDGKKRTVHYTADDRHGFRASVQNT